MTSQAFLTEEELSARLRVCRGTLKGWRRQGIGPRYVRLNRAVRYPLADLEQWLAERAVDETVAA